MKLQITLEMESPAVGGDQDGDVPTGATSPAFATAPTGGVQTVVHALACHAVNFQIVNGQIGNSAGSGNDAGTGPVRRVQETTVMRTAFLTTPEQASTASADAGSGGAVAVNAGVHQRQRSRSRGRGHGEGEGTSERDDSAFHA